MILTLGEVTLELSNSTGHFVFSQVFLRLFRVHARKPG